MIVKGGGLEVRTTPLAVPSPGNVVLKLTNLGGWYSGAPLRNGVEVMPAADGGFDTDQSYRGMKVMSWEGFVLATSVEEAEELGYDQIAGIAPNGEDFELEVESSSGLIRYITCRVDGAPTVTPWTDRRARFQIPLLSVDPRKYGEWEVQTALPQGTSGDGLIWPLMGTVTTGVLDFGTFSPSGLVEFENTGTAPSYVIFEVSGGIDSAGFRITSGANVIEYLAAVPNGQVLTLDPYAGGRATIGGVDVTGASLTRSEWAPIRKGESRAFSFDPLGTADASAAMTARFRKAWW